MCNSNWSDKICTSKCMLQIIQSTNENDKQLLDGNSAYRLQCKHKEIEGITSGVQGLNSEPTFLSPCYKF
jgi:uncharacterized protein YecA (UPF0149 family)